MNMKQCPQCGGEMHQENSGIDMPDGDWKCTDCGNTFEKRATGEVTRREMILVAAGISLVGVPESDSFEHKTINDCLVALWFPPGTTNTIEGVIDNRDVARECLDGIEADSKLILPSTRDEHGCLLWDLRVFNLGGRDAKSDVRKSSS